MAPAARSLAPFEPHAHLARLVARFDVDDPRAAAHRAVLGVRLLRAASGIDMQLVAFAAEGAGDGGGRAAAPLSFHGGHGFDREYGNDVVTVRAWTSGIVPVMLLPPFEAGDDRA